MAYGIKLKVSGNYACFSRPEMKSEPVSYDVMTPSAARGILEAIHWKPAVRWVIDAIHVLEPIRFQSICRNEVGSKAPYSNIKSASKRGDLAGLQLLVDGDRQQRTASVLVKPAYLIEAHFNLTDKAGAEDNEGKHLDIFNRRAAKGQCFHQPCLGMQEFDAAFSLIAPDEPLPQTIKENRDLGFMLWDIDHAAPGRPSMLFRAKLENGVMWVPQPGSQEIRR